MVTETVIVIARGIMIMRIRSKRRFITIVYKNRLRMKLV
jgi:hypothetical protein